MSAETINFTYSEPEHHTLRRFMIRSIETISGQPRLKKLYQRYIDQSSHIDFFDAAVALLEIDVRYCAKKLESIPKAGPLVFIANHPYGVLDGIVLTWICKKVRPDVKVMANNVLCQAKAARNNLLPVDFSDTREALQTNLLTRKLALQTVKSGGAVGIFPAGGVGASKKPFWGPAVDPGWHPFAAKLVRKSGATVVPIYFGGQNSRLFQIASHLSYTLRLSLFFFETARKIDSGLEMVVGDPISFQDLPGNNCKDALLKELRRRTYLLAEQTRILDNNKRPTLPKYDSEYVYPKHFGF